MTTKRISIHIVVSSLALFALPIFASAHAMPLEYVPASSTTVDAVPALVEIRLSEHLEQGASQISVAGPRGEVVSLGKAVVDQKNSKVISVPIRNGGNGTYIVSWNVVSADDGHFTEGSYVFAVGKGFVADASTASNTEVVQIATTPEVLGMTVEFVGNGIIWAALIFLALVFRPEREKGISDKEQKALGRGYAIFVLGGTVLAFIGAVTELLVKAQSLAGVQKIAFSGALPVYIQTAAGQATLFRALILVAIFLVLLFFKKKIVASRKFSLYEIVLTLLLLLFAYFRAKISHATANPFYPGFSISVNFFHLIAKDMWSGLAIISLALVLSKNLRSLFFQLIPKIFCIWSYVVGAVSVTACYIVWLHLKDFGNIFTTSWGGIFLELLCMATLLVLIRLYHVFARIFRPNLFQKLLPMSFAAETVIAILVIYSSSAILITSPPLTKTHESSYIARDQGQEIRMEKDIYEDGMVLLYSTDSKPIETPVVRIENESTGARPISVDASPRFRGGYAFPASFLSGSGPFKVSITILQQGGYDAHASFDVAKDDFSSSDFESGRSFDSFSLIMCLISLSSLVFCFVIYRYSRIEKDDSFEYKVPEFSAALGLIIAALVGGYLIRTIDSSAWANPFKALCVADGNMWHLMLPSKAGKPVSLTPREGCMWGMGNYMYMFPDMREYSYYRTMEKADVVLKTLPEKIQTGIPTTIAVSLTETDGTPATLFVDMEKLLHMVIISEDETVFAHIHADDIRPLSQKEIDSSIFDFDYTFPKAGKYMVSVDYAHGLQLESKQFTVEVKGSPEQKKDIATYSSPGKFGGYDVVADFGQPYAGEVATMRYTITHNGKPVDDIEPYLAAAMHVSVIKNDLTSFIHVHGEVHPPGTPYPPIIIKDGQVVHSMAMMTLPAKLGPNIEAHLIFPTAGIYTVWGEFKMKGIVIPTAFTVRVE